MMAAVPRRREPAVDAAGFVLAGGQSSRMGREKALVELAGRPLIAHALTILRRAGVEASIAGARASLESFAPVVADRDPGQGPLAGICAALHSTAAGWAVFVPLDLPLLPPSLVAYLLWHAQTTGQPIAIASRSGFPQTFPAVVDRVALPLLEAELAEGRRGCFAAFQAAAQHLGAPLAGIPVELLAQAGQVSHPGGLSAPRWFLNVNAPADLECAAFWMQTPNCVSW